MGRNRDDSLHHVQDLRQSAMSSSLFSIIILAYWDNVMGPMVSKIWKGNDKVEASDETVNYISNHTLSGELCRQTEKQTVDPKLCILPDLGYLFNAFIFTGNSKMGPTITSLSFVIAHEDLNKFLMLQDHLERQVKVIVLRYRVFQQKDVGSAIKCVSPSLKKLIKTIDMLAENNIPPEICVATTIFGEGENAALLLDSRFLMRSLTSHLQTCGCTVVVGQSADKVNLMIHTLSLFLGKNECFCSTLASDENTHQFYQDLWLQGIIGKAEENMSSKDVLLNTYPVTLINVDEKLVYQTIYASVHAIKRRDNLKTEASLLLHGTELSNIPTRELFTDDFGDISLLVQKFITQLFSIPNNCSIRRNHIENFKQTLQRKASTFLSYVENKSNNGRSVLTQPQLQLLKQDLGLSCEADFRVVLATAEKHRPGLSLFLVEAIQRGEDSFQVTQAPVKGRVFY
eukprot:TCONS_00015962-protein